jgi:Ca-activated chloride channel family protein
MKLFAFFLIGVMCVREPLSAQERTRILFLVDGSLSMRNEWKGGTKWNIATEVLHDLADSIQKIPNTEIGMRVFGHLYPEPDKNCRDSRLEVRIDSNNAKAIQKKLLEIRPKGITPLVYSIERSATDFGNVVAKNIIIIITDGEDACEGDPCSVSLTLQQNNIVLRPFIIGMQLNPKSFEAMNCMGKLYNTNSSEEFIATMKKVVIEAISKTTFQVNLLDKEKKPTETNVNMTLFDSETGLPKYHFYHTMNARGLPDTITVSPMFNYQLQIHTIPSITIDNIQFKQNEHRVIEVNAAQGSLQFGWQQPVLKNINIDRVKFLVKPAGGREILFVQPPNSTEKYLAGSYDVEVLTLPRVLLTNVKIDQSKTTEILIPAPGLLVLQKNSEVIGSILYVEKGQLVKVCDLKAKDKIENIALQPGRYRLIYRPKFNRSIHTSVDKEIEITSGGSVSLKL